MEKRQQIAAITNAASASSLQASSLDDPLSGSGALDLSPPAAQYVSPPTTPNASISSSKDFKRLIKRYAILASVFLLVSGGVVFVIGARAHQNSSNSVKNGIQSTQIPLSQFSHAASLLGDSTKKVSINGSLQLNGSVVLDPQTQPAQAASGQMYYDKNTNQLNYYNGASFVPLTKGVVHITSGSPLMTVTDNGNGNVTLTVLQGDTGAAPAVASLNGLSGVLSLANATALGTIVTINDASTSGKGIASFNAGNFTVLGGAVNTVQDIGPAASPSFASLNVTGALTLGTPLSVASGGTGTTSFTANGLVLGQGTGALTTITSGGTGLCLLSTAGAPAFQVCPGSGGSVLSLNGLTGALTVANATGAGSTITIDNATTAAKGIASFNAANFTVTSGAVDTVQNIGTTASPTFAGVTAGTATVSGAAALNGDATLGTNSANRLHLNSEIVAGSIILQGATDDAFTTTINISDPTANRIITIPNTSGTLPIATSGSSQGGVSAFVQNGSAWNGIANLGTNDAFDLNFRTNATTRLSVTSAGDVTFASGAGNFDQSASTGTFKTGTGNVTLNGNTTVTAGKTFTADAVSTNAVTPSAALTLGANTQSFTLQGTASSSITATNATGTTTLAFAAPSTAGTVTFQLPAGGAAATTYDICTTLTVCAGYGSGSGSGNYIQNGTSTQTATLNIQSGNAANTTAVIQGAAGTAAAALIITQGSGQTGYLMQLQNSSGTPLVNFDVNGNESLANLTATGSVAAPVFSTADSTTGSTATVTLRSGNTTFAGANSGNITIDTGSPGAGGTAGAITLGVTNATAINLNQNTAVAAGKSLTVNGTALFKNNADSSTAFRVQNAAGDTYLGIDSSGATANFGNVNIASTVNLGTTGAGAAVAQTIRVGTNSTAGATNTVIIGNSAATASTVTINGGTGAGAVSMQAGAGGTISVGTSNAVTLAFGSTAANGSTFTSKSSATAFQIQNASSVALFTVDTANARLYVGPIAGDTTGTLLVLGKKTSAGDPTGVEGAMYYSANSLTMRCFHDGTWADCMTANPIDRSFTVQDEFTSGQSGSGTIGALGWQNTAIGVAGTATYNSTTYLSATNPGVLILTTPTTTSQGSTIRAAGGGVASWTLAAGNRFKSTVAEDNTSANTTLRIGLHAESSATARPTTGVWWEADPTNNANWEYCFGTGAAATCAASSVAIANTTFVRTEIRLTATGSGTSSATFLINGNSYSVSAVTIDTATKVSPAMSCFTQANAAGVCALDYVWAYGEAPNGR